jgi:hypothetical protein
VDNTGAVGRRDLPERTSPRLLLAAGVAALTALVVFLACVWVIQLASGAPPTQAATDVFGHLSLFVLFLAWPVLFGLVALISVPGYHILRRRLPSRLPLAMVAIGGIAGAVLMPLFWNSFWGSMDNIWVWLLVGTTCGATAGLAFWVTTK